MVDSGLRLDFFRAGNRLLDPNQLYDTIAGHDPDYLAVFVDHGYVGKIAVDNVLGSVLYRRILVDGRKSCPGRVPEREVRDHVMELGGFQEVGVVGVDLKTRLREPY